MEPRLTAEGWGDFVTLAVFGALFATKAILIILRNRQTQSWDALAKALATVNVVLVLLFIICLVSMWVGHDIRPPWMRWLLRVVGSYAAVWAIVRLVSDRPGKMRRKPVLN